MGNTILTDVKITRAALAILHEKLQFVGNINRQYDSSFAQSGAKIGSQLKVRLPNSYTVRTGRKAVPQDTNERSETLTVATQKGVDLQFYSDELTLSIDDFSKRILEPAMAVLATNIEADALSMSKDVWNGVGTPGTAPSTLLQIMQTRGKLQQYLAPEGDGRTMLVNTEASAALIDTFKTFNQDAKSIGGQYKEGFITRAGGFNFYESNILTTMTSGTRSSTAGRTNSATAQTGSSLITNSFSGGATIKAGECFTIDGVYAVHPETKTAYNFLQKFVVTADVTADGSGNATLSISPEIIASGAYQNVSNGAANSKQLTFDSALSTSHVHNLGFHRDAFTFVSADLEMPKGMDMAAREVQDGISLRFVRGYDIMEDQFIGRFDILYGYMTLRPELACKLYG